MYGTLNAYFQPVPLAGVVALDAVGFLLADVDLALRDGLLVGGAGGRHVASGHPGLTDGE